MTISMVPPGSRMGCNCEDAVLEGEKQSKYMPQFWCKPCGDHYKKKEERTKCKGKKRSTFSRWFLCTSWLFCAPSSSSSPVCPPQPMLEAGNARSGGSNHTHPRTCRMAPGQPPPHIRGFILNYPQPPNHGSNCRPYQLSHIPLSHNSQSFRITPSPHLLVSLLPAIFSTNIFFARK